MYTYASVTYRKQQILRGTKLLRFSQIFNKTQKFSLLILGYDTSWARGQKLPDPCGPLGQEVGKNLTKEANKELAS